MRFVLRGCCDSSIISVKMLLILTFGFGKIGGYWSRRHVHAVCFSGFSAMFDLSKGGCQNFRMVSLEYKQYKHSSAVIS